MKNNKILLGVLGGLAAGALTGILFAPAKGTKTRKRIMKKSYNMTNDIKSKFENLVETATDKCQSILHEAQEMVAKNDPR